MPWLVGKTIAMLHDILSPTSKEQICWKVRAAFWMSVGHAIFKISAMQSLVSLVFRIEFISMTE